MSLDKAIKYRKEHRKEYRGAKSVDPSCRNHNGCDWCKGNRTYQSRKQIQKTNEEMATFTRWQDPTIEELQQRIDKARNYFEDKYFDFLDERYKRMIEILDGEEGETSAR